MNMELFRLINNLANKNSILDKIMIFFSKDVPYIFMAVIAIVFVLGITKKNSDYRKIAVNTFVITIINLFLSFIIGGIYYVDRPFVNNKVNLLYTHVKNASFPSDHATGTMSIALGLGKYNRLLSLILTILSLIVGFSRVYVGHHYPMDIIGAYIIVFATSHIYNLKLRSKVENLYEVVEKKLVARFGIK
ncbi:phosphatase PAP2 family protein [Clostridium uliginosum]|uniref:Undecaprenyl-diphosphatase n=1 Tax=Clostridium uliginosum TaxID=119641 RepID=A0A1I1QUW7_9CLOT|nr:phosphatase PAP2 family protein [Clostridium uliginosum]SFD23668.1 undecaprenyl-diphosphatase [Clostridium uliginosum]